MWGVRCKQTSSCVAHGPNHSCNRLQQPTEMFSLYRNGLPPSPPPSPPSLPPPPPPARFPSLLQSLRVTAISTGAQGVTAYLSYKTPGLRYTTFVVDVIQVYGIYCGRGLEVPLPPRRVPPLDYHLQVTRVFHSEEVTQIYLSYMTVEGLYTTYITRLRNSYSIRLRVPKVRPPSSSSSSSSSSCPSIVFV